jgi:hypothetical protein
VLDGADPAPLAVGVADGDAGLTVAGAVLTGAGAVGTVERCARAAWLVLATWAVLASA